MESKFHLTCFNQNLRALTKNEVSSVYQSSVWNRRNTIYGDCFLPQDAQLTELHFDRGHLLLLVAQEKSTGIRRKLYHIDPEEIIHLLIDVETEDWNFLFNPYAEEIVFACRNLDIGEWIHYKYQYRKPESPLRVLRIFLEDEIIEHLFPDGSYLSTKHYEISGLCYYPNPQEEPERYILLKYNVSGPIFLKIVDMHQIILGPQEEEKSQYLYIFDRREPEKVRSLMKLDSLKIPLDLNAEVYPLKIDFFPNQNMVLLLNGQNLVICEYSPTNIHLQEGKLRHQNYRSIIYHRKLETPEGKKGAYTSSDRTELVVYNNNQLIFYEYMARIHQSTVFLLDFHEGHFDILRTESGENRHYFVDTRIHSCAQILNYQLKFGSLMPTIPFHLTRIIAAYI